MENQDPQTLTKKSARLQVGQALFSLTELEKALGKKKFKRRLEKAERILVEGLPKEKKNKKTKAKSNNSPDPLEAVA